MKNTKTGDIITITNHPAFEKNELTAAEKTALPVNKDMDFIETLFLFCSFQSSLLFHEGVDLNFALLPPKVERDPKNCQDTHSNPAKIQGR